MVVLLPAHGLHQEHLTQWFAALPLFLPWISTSRIGPEQWVWGFGDWIWHDFVDISHGRMAQLWIPCYSRGAVPAMNQREVALKKVADVVSRCQLLALAGDFHGFPCHRWNSRNRHSFLVFIVSECSFVFFVPFCEETKLVSTLTTIALYEPSCDHLHLDWPYYSPLLNIIYID